MMSMPYTTADLVTISRETMQIFISALFSIFLIANFSGTAAAGEAASNDTLCLGSQNTKHPLVIYLHGIDSQTMSAQELAQRKTLDALGKKLGLRFFAPRSNTTCSRPNAGKLCWPMQSQAQLKQESKRLLGESSRCGETVSGWIGFSNGGYFVGKLVQHCIDHPGWALAIGSAGSWQADQTSFLQKCGALSLLIGTKDITLPAAKKFAAHLKQRNALIDIHEFEGGHEIKGSALETLLQSLQLGDSQVTDPK